MRKDEFKEFEKGLIKAWMLAALFFTIGLSLVGEYDAAITMTFIVTLMFGSIYIAVVIGNKINLFSKKNDIEKKSNEYEREIPKGYTVSMASLLLDNAFDEIVDIPAIILSLIGKNILIYEDNKVNVQHIENYSNLYNHEKYVYECIKENKTIQPYKFRKLVIEDAMKCNYIKKNNPKNPMKKSILIFLALILLVFICSISLTILPEFLYNSIIIILAISTMTSPIAILNRNELDEDNPYKNTSLGNKEVRKLLGLKKYLEEFSMIDNKKIKEAIVWEDYLAYAYIFGINKKIFEEFKELKQINNIVN